MLSYILAIVIKSKNVMTFQRLVYCLSSNIIVRFGGHFLLLTFCNDFINNENIVLVFHAKKYGNSLASLCSSVSVF